MVQRAGVKRDDLDQRMHYIDVAIESEIRGKGGLSVVQKPIQVAQIMGRMMGGGLEATIMNHYRFLNHDEVQFDFIVQEDSDHVPSKEILDAGGRIYTVPSYKNLPNYIKTCKHLFTEIRPDIVHSNMNALSVFPLRAAKRGRHSHSHCT